MREVPLVGREPERDSLWGALTATVADGLCRCVVLRGEAGTGKSRLAEWAVRRAHEVGVATSFEVRGGSDPLPRLLASSLGMAEVLADGLAERVGERTAGWAEGASPGAELIGDVLLPARRRERGQSPLSHQERCEVVRRVLKATAAGRVRIVWFDDAQAAPESVAFADALLKRRRVAPVPLLLLLTVRDEAVAPGGRAEGLLASLEGRSGAEVVRVAALEAAAHRDLVRGLLGLDGRLARAVERRTAGNPQFAIQLVGDWVRRGLLVPGMRGFELRAGAEAPLPADIDEVWTTRVDAVLASRPPDARRAVERAAALGEDVDPVEWREACADLAPEVLEQTVEALLEARLARPGGGWSFAHPMLRESVQRRAERDGRWVEASRTCADVVERLGGAGAEPERLGRLLAAAHRPRRALGPLLEAAAERLVTSDYQVGEALTKLAAEQLEAAAVPAEEPQRGEVAFLTLRFDLAQGRFDEAEQRAVSLLEQAGRYGWTTVEVSTARFRAAPAMKQGRFAVAVELLGHGLQLASARGMADQEAECLLDLAFIAKLEGNFEPAIEAATRALVRFEAAGLLRRQAECQLLFGQIHALAGRSEEAGRALLRSLELLEDTGSRFSQAVALNSLGEVHRARGYSQAAAACYRECAATFAELGSSNEVFPLINLGVLADEPSAEVLAGLERAVLLADEAGNPGLADLACTVLLPLAGEAGRDTVWSRCLTRALSRIEAGAVDDPDQQESLRRAARFAIGAGRPDEAAALEALISSTERPR